MLKQFTNYKGEKQNINFDLAFGANQGSSTKANNKWIIAHSTASPNAPAKNIANYFRNNWNTVQSYTHFSVDDASVYASGEQGYVAWGAGPTGNNNSPVQVELCEFSDKTRAMNAYKNFVNFLRDASRDTGIPISNIVTHKWLANTYHETNHTDPQTYLTSLGISEDQFKKDLQTGFTAKPVEAQPSQPANNTSSKRYKLSVGVAVYDKADLSKQVGTLKANEVVEYTDKLVGKTYTWLKLKNGKFIIASQNEKPNGIYID